MRFLQNSRNARTPIVWLLLLQLLFFLSFLDLGLFEFRFERLEKRLESGKVSDVLEVLRVFRLLILDEALD